jgi:hypothetical protein
MMAFSLASLPALLGVVFGAEALGRFLDFSSLTAKTGINPETREELMLCEDYLSFLALREPGLFLQRNFDPNLAQNATRLSGHAFLSFLIKELPPQRLPERANVQIRHEGSSFEIIIETEISGTRKIEVKKIFPPA